MPCLGPFSHRCPHVLRYLGPVFRVDSACHLLIHLFVRLSGMITRWRLCANATSRRFCMQTAAALKSTTGDGHVTQYSLYWRNAASKAQAKKDQFTALRS